MANASLSPIYERLNGVQQYHPFSAKTFADWASEAGDTVQISREGTSYSVPVHKQSLVWRGKHMINMESTGSKERTPIERMSNRKENETSAGMSAARGYGGGAGRKIDHLLYEIDNPETGLAMRLEANEEFADLIYTKSGLNELGQSETLMTRIHQNAESISLEARRASLAEGVLQGKITVEADRITQEVSRASLAEGVLQGKITVEADRITQEVARASLAEGILDGKITVEAGKITQIVSAVGSNGQVTAASICLAINNGGSTATINADKIYLLGQTIANTITADYIETKIASLSVLRAAAISSTGNISCSNGYIMAPYFYLGSAGNATNVANAIMALKVVQSGNDYKIQKMDFDDGDWVDVPGTFSRATTLSGTWSGGTFTVSASPQGNSISAGLFDVTGSDISWSGNTASFPVYANLNGGETKYDTGKRLTVNASARYTAGYNEGKSDYRPDDIRISGKNVYVLNSAGDDVGGPYSCATIYNNGYNDADSHYTHRYTGTLYTNGTIPAGNGSWYTKS